VTETPPEPPALNPEPDNDPDDTAELPEVEFQDRDGHERPAQDKHPED
jgi:hypothetical protein